MDDYDDEPELAGYVENTGRPLHSSRRLLVMRIVVVTGVLCLVLPQVFTMTSVASTTAATACRAWVNYEASSDTGASARFEMFGQGGPGWQCYTVGAFGGDRHVATLGLIPISPKLSPVPK
jgi:hypothetical protein